MYTCALNYHLHLITFLNGSHHAEYTRKLNLQKTKVNTTRFVQMEINFVLGKNRGHMPSSQVRQYVDCCCQVVWQADKFLQFTINSTTAILKLFEWIYGANSFV